MFEYKKLSTLYSLDKNITRVKNYIQEFQNNFKANSFFVLRTPGRVNLIGEHIDYSHLPVLPAGIEKDIYIIFSPRTDNLVNIQSFQNKFSNTTFEISRHITPFSQGHWVNYVKAGIQTIIDFFDKTGTGFNALVAGNIPAGSGLSSSSALVVASAGAYLTVNNLKMKKLQFAEKMAEGEKYVGTAGGGMDQASSIFAKLNHAIKIDFAPLEINHIPLPEDYDIIIAQSLTVAEKSKGAKDAFNLRSMETKIVTTLLSQFFKMNYGEEFQIQFIGDLRKPQFKKIRQNITNIIDELFFSKDRLNIHEIHSLLKLNNKEINTFFTLKNGTLFPYNNYEYKLKKRIHHIISEWQRVEESVIALSEGKITRFGELMTESHQSCKLNYEISREELDTLVDIELSAGATGARLTGAGFGGSTVSLVLKSKSDNFIETVIEKYYTQYLKKKNPNLSLDSFENIIFKTKATEGTCLIDL